MDSTSILQDTIKQIFIVTSKELNLQQNSQFLDTNLLIVIATAISLIVSLLVNWYLNKLGYKNEYYKKIIEKRLQTYELVEGIVNKMRVFSEHGNKRCPSLVFGDWDKYDKFRSDLIRIGERSYWLSDEMDNKLLELNNYLLVHVEENRNVANSVEIGIKHYQDLVKFCAKIQTLLVRDYKTLHNIRSFINEKAPSKTRRLLIKLRLRKQ